MWASRLSIRRAGPERREVKKTRSGRFSVTDGLLAGSLDEQRRRGTRGYGSHVGSWYWIGVSAGLGAAAGVLFGGIAGEGRGARIFAMLLAGAVGAGIGFEIGSWQSGGWGDRAAGIAGGLAGALGATQTVSGALRRGGTRVATGVLVACGAILVAALAWIPAAGYLIVLVLRRSGAAAQAVAARALRRFAHARPRRVGPAPCRRSSSSSSSTG